VGGDDDFWDDLLGHIRDQKLVTVVGPDVTVVNVGGAEQTTLTSLIGERLAEKYQLTMSPGMTMGEAVAMFLPGRSQGEVVQVYRVINDIIEKLDPAPGDALRDLAAITDLRLLVSTTPDRLLAKAVNEVRFQGKSATRELTASLKQSTSEQPENEPRASATDSVVLNLFGQAASTPQYAIHEEDRLEWLHALLRDEASLPDWLARQLRAQPLLFVGCEIPDWVGPFLLRMSSNDRLFSPGKQFFFVPSFVPSPTPYEPSLSNFFETYCHKPQVQQLPMEPIAFVAELRARWERARPRDAVAPPLSGPNAPTIFISYMREDVDAAKRLYNAISNELGGDAWFDEHQLRAGDAWELEILTAIRKTVQLFVPVISANTERVDEGYVFREWNEAAERLLSIMGRKFIVPVIVDADYEGDSSRYRKMPDAFRDFQFGHAPSGDPNGGLRAMLTEQIRAMRKTGAE
jgi:hypothetical protein